MEYIGLIGTVTLIHLLAVMSPGPDLVMVLKNALSYSRKTGVWTAVGLGIGIAVHVFYSLAGLALIISQSILVFNIIKLIGAAYLIYIGVMSIISDSSKIDVTQTEKKEEISPLQAIKIGFLTNVLNPKATLFFLSLFTLVISPDTPKIILGLLSAIMIINTALWFSLVSIFFTQKKIQQKFNKIQGKFNKVMGGLLIILGIKVALTQK